MKKGLYRTVKMNANYKHTTSRFWLNIKIYRKKASSNIILATKTIVKD